VARRSRRTGTRIGHEARAATTGTLDAALREGQLDLAELISPDRSSRGAKIAILVGVTGTVVAVEAAVAFGVAGFRTVAMLIGG